MNKESTTCFLVVVVSVSMLRLLYSKYDKNENFTCDQRNEPSITYALNEPTFLNYLKYLDTNNIYVPLEYRTVSYYLEHKAKME